MSESRCPAGVDSRGILGPAFLRDAKPAAFTSDRQYCPVFRPVPINRLQPTNGNLVPRPAPFLFLLDGLADKSAQLQPFPSVRQLVPFVFGLVDAGLQSLQFRLDAFLLGVNRR